MEDTDDENGEAPVEGEFEGEEDLERLLLVFMTEEGNAVATVEGSKVPPPEAGEVVSFGVGERIFNLPEKEFHDRSTTTGREYKIEDREFSFVNQAIEHTDIKIGPLTRGRSGQGLTTLVLYTVSEIE